MNPDSSTENDKAKNSIKTFYTILIADRIPLQLPKFNDKYFSEYDYTYTKFTFTMPIRLSFFTFKKLYLNAGSEYNKI